MAIFRKKEEQEKQLKQPSTPEEKYSSLLRKKTIKELIAP